MKKNSEAMGRKPGFVVPAESRHQAALNNPHRIAISTPFGDFPSCGMAARALGISPECIRYRAVQGGIQRAEIAEFGKRKTGNTDFTGWFRTEKKVSTKAGMKVVTPLGQFDKMSDACAAHQICFANLQRLIEKHPTLYYKL